MPIIPLAGTSAPKGAIVPIGFSRLTTQGTDIIFSNIPQIYQDLMVVCNVRTVRNDTTTATNLYINAGSADNWSATNMYADGTAFFTGKTTTAAGGAGPTFGAFSWNPSSATDPDTYGSVVYHIINYRTTTFKTVLHRAANDTTGSQAYNINLSASLWASTAAITSLIVGSGFGAPFTIGSTFSLYGIRTVNQ